MGFKNTKVQSKLFDFHGCETYTRARRVYVCRSALGGCIASWCFSTALCSQHNHCGPVDITRLLTL